MANSTHATPSGPPAGGGFGQTIAYDDFVGVTTDGTSGTKPWC
ncbi:hypothetical protein ABZ357_18475 [Streptomyces sp. NPDC005917]